MLPSIVRDLLNGSRINVKHLLRSVGLPSAQIDQTIISLEHPLHSQIVACGEFVTPVSGKVSFFENAIFCRESYQIFDTNWNAYIDAYHSEELMHEIHEKYPGGHGCLQKSQSVDGFVEYGINRIIINSPFDVAQCDSLKFIIVRHIDHSNYWHWHYEILPRLIILREIMGRRALKHIKYYVIGSRLTGFQVLSLSLCLGYTPNIIYVENKLLASQVIDILPPFPANYSVRILRALNVSLRMHKHIAPQKDLGNLTYIPRGNNRNGRNIVNASEIKEKLIQIGFSIAQMDSVSYLDQQRIIEMSQLIVAPHGAALANLIFAKANTVVIELGSSRYPHAEAQITSALRNISHYRILSNKTAETTGPHADSNHTDYYVGLHILVELIEHLRFGDPPSR